MTKFGGYSIRTAQIDDEMKEKLKFRFYPNLTISLLVSWSVMPHMSCFSIGGLKNQHDAILEPFGATEEILISLTRSPSTTYSLPLSNFFTFLLLNFLKPPLLDFLDSLNFSVKF